jgi:phenylacetate-coenzyme A ligase PaaK-like adenylate-forming protein
VRPLLARTRITFVHSGGWKRLEAERIDAATLERELLAPTAPGSRVLDYYGLVEQVGLIFPLCAGGFRHVPVWADVVVRNAVNLDPLEDQPGLLQLLNVLPRGAPCQSVLTEDLGRIASGACSCGRSGKRFEFLGRVPKAEVRGCANV